MQLSAVVLARVIYFIESIDLNPRGQAYYPDVIRSLVERYRFLGFPQKLEDFDETKGVTLTSGRFENRNVDKVVIYNWGLTLENTASTTDAEQLLDEALTWATQNLHLRYESSMIKRKAYVSHITFYSESSSLMSMNHALKAAADAISKSVLQHLKLPYTFEPSGVLVGIDPEEQRIPVQRFTIERRDGIAFRENKYFSAAPVPTDLHLRVVEDFEKAILAQTRNVAQVTQR